jgi:D-alanyl-D-alanine carboxypeptidase
MDDNTLPDNLIPLLNELGLSMYVIQERRMAFHAEAHELSIAEVGADGREHRLIPEAAQAWTAMKQAAARDGITLEIVSAFRDLAEQAAIIRDKLERAMPIEKILSLSAPPGFSEHHTGRAVDINMPGCIPREEPFETTAAFSWLTQHAGRYGFTMSYPRGNRAGFIYEPWHWLFDAP